MSSSATKLIPDSNAQYLYTLGMCWSDKGQSDCTPGSLVENVRLEGAFFSNLIVWAVPSNAIATMVGHLC